MQAVDVGLGKNAAFAGNRMELHAVVAHLRQFLGRNAQLGVDLIDYRPGPPGAFVVHAGKLLLLAGLRVFLEDDDLGILAAQLNDRAALRIELLHG